MMFAGDRSVTNFSRVIYILEYLLTILHHFLTATFISVWLVLDALDHQVLHFFVLNNNNVQLNVDRVTSVSSKTVAQRIKVVII